MKVHNSGLYPARTLLFLCVGFYLILGNSIGLFLGTIAPSLLYSAMSLGLLFLAFGVARFVQFKKGILINEKLNFIPVLLMFAQIVKFYVQEQGYEEGVLATALLTTLFLYNINNHLTDSRVYYSVILGVFGLFIVGIALKDPSNQQPFMDFEQKRIADIVQWSYFSLVALTAVFFFQKAKQDTYAKLFYERKMKEVVDRLNKIVAHNIRGPIATLQLQLDLERLRGTPNLKFESLVKQLVQTTDDLFAFDSNHQNFSLDELFKRLEGAYGAQVIFDLDVDRNQTILAGNAYYFALQNFISNAIKYSSNKPTVYFTTCFDELVVQVSDSGLGMNSKRLESIGQALQSDHGLGIGLSLGLELLNNFGYHVMIQSKMGLGTSVVICQDGRALQFYENPEWPVVCFNAVEIDVNALIAQEASAV